MNIDKVNELITDSMAERVVKLDKAIERLEYICYREDDTFIKQVYYVQIEQLKLFKMILED